MPSFHITYEDTVNDIEEGNLLGQFLFLQGEPYHLAYVLRSNYDFNETKIEGFIVDAGTSQAVALALWWQLSPDYWHKFASESDVPDFQQYSYDRFRELESNYLSGFYAQPTVAFDPRTYYSTTYGLELVLPAGSSDLFLEPVAGREGDVDALTHGWDNGLPPEVWQPMQLIWQLEDSLAEGEIDVGLPFFRDLVLRAYREGRLSGNEVHIDLERWLGADRQPTFPEWRDLPEDIWQPLTVMHMLYKQTP